ncbi:hypothetical protein GGQ74_000069 [Desulfobaculum xiamenense]|uniref:Uncharacterized protein n=1 Tax=Desulfobaculum xiamenense TaxID=995050 RepID=A0A846QNZ6_9BACT|nr:hypothetical protein [Desulfobaculum xiamenense]NJB66429.1 hypothetical protein [Desulfobaculum xiamenense]
MWEWIAMAALSVISYVARPKPPKPNVQNAKAAGIADLDIPVAEEGRSVPVVFGRVIITSPSVVWFGDLKTKAIRRKT